jgi:hypothetical protein
MTEPTPTAAEASHSYAGSTLGNTFCGIVFLILAAFYTWIAWPVLGVLVPTMIFDPATMKTALGALFLPPLLFGLGLYRIGNAVCGLPRLTATPKGIELETLCGKKWASWGSVGEFALNRGWAYAAVIGTDAKVNRIFGRNFVIPGIFALSTPIKTIICDVNAVRAEALRQSPALEAEVYQREQTDGRRRVRLAVATFVVLMSIVFLVTKFHA